MFAVCMGCVRSGWVWRCGVDVWCKCMVGTCVVCVVLCVRSGVVCVLCGKRVVSVLCIV